MSTSTNGILWYGVVFDGSHEDGDEPATAIHDIVWGDEDSEDDLYGDGREWMAEHAITGVEFVEHCSHDYPMWGLAVAGSVTTARRGYPVTLKPLPQPPDEPIVAALRALNLDPGDYAIGWHLASMWS